MPIEMESINDPVGGGGPFLGGSRQIVSGV
jgi:hypothetical protein